MHKIDKKMLKYINENQPNERNMKCVSFYVIREAERTVLEADLKGFSISFLCFLFDSFFNPTTSTLWLERCES